MRVMKIKALQRTKAFNVLQLADFIVMHLDSHYQRRLIDVTNERFQLAANALSLSTSIITGAQHVITVHSLPSSLCALLTSSCDIPVLSVKSVTVVQSRLCHGLCCNMHRRNPSICVCQVYHTGETCVIQLQIGRMHESNCQLRKLCGSVVMLTVNPDITADELLTLAVEKHSACN